MVMAVFFFFGEGEGFQVHSRFCSAVLTLTDEITNILYTHHSVPWCVTQPDSPHHIAPYLQNLLFQLHVLNYVLEIVMNGRKQ